MNNVQPRVQILNDEVASLWLPVNADKPQHWIPWFVQLQYSGNCTWTFNVRHVTKVVEYALDKFGRCYVGPPKSVALPVPEHLIKPNKLTRYDDLTEEQRQAIEAEELADWWYDQ